MELILICVMFIISSIINIFCFIIGAKVGQSVSKGADVKLPNLNPIKLIKEQKENKENREQLEKYNTMFENINNYDGTGMGQKDL